MQSINSEINTHGRSSVEQVADTDINTTIKFRPFRIVDGAVIVTSYMGWRRLVTNFKKGNYASLSAEISIVKEMHVMNNDGELLFWPSDLSFEKFPVLKMICYDCEGVPALSHQQIKQVDKREHKDCFDPLMTSIVVREFHKMNELFKIRWIKLLK